VFCASDFGLNFQSKVYVSFAASKVVSLGYTSFGRTANKDNTGFWRHMYMCQVQQVSCPVKWFVECSNFLAVSIHSQAKESESRVQMFGDLYLAFNAHPSLVLATIPEPPQNMTWVRIADSSFPYPDNFLLEGTHLEFPSPDGRYNFQPYSSVILEARPVTQWHDPTGSA
jgi:hypothetical protein